LDNREGGHGDLDLSHQFRRGTKLSSGAAPKGSPFGCKEGQTFSASDVCKGRRLLKRPFNP